MGRKSDLTKARIAAALEALLEDVPLSRITVSAVARQAGTNRQTFYYHFETLDDLVTYLCQQKVQLLSSEVAACTNVRALFAALVGQVGENRAIFKKVLNGVGRGALREAFHDDAKAVLLKQARAVVDAYGAHPSTQELDFAVEYCVLASASVVAGWIDGAVSATQDELTEALAQSFEQQMSGLAFSLQ